MNGAYLFFLVVQVVALVLGLVVHECAHALAAYLLGDKTARSAGRLSLNPLAHIDPFGTVLLPLIMIALGGPAFAFAKPVPVNLSRLKHPKRDEVLVALAGPASNIALAAAGAALVGLLAGNAGSLGFSATTSLAFALQYFMVVNLSLAFFNLIPLPPLDGSSILVPFLKGRALARYYEIQRYAMPILLIVLYLVPNVLHVDIVGIYFDYTVYPLLDFLLNCALG